MFEERFLPKLLANERTRRTPNSQGLIIKYKGKSGFEINDCGMRNDSEIKMSGLFVKQLCLGKVPCNFHQTKICWVTSIQALGAWREEDGV